MWDQIRSNRIRSVVVVTLLGVLLVAFGAALGSVFGGRASSDAVLVGAGISVGLWFVLWGVAVGSGDRILLSIAGGREVTKSDHPVLLNVVEEMSIAAVLPRSPRVFVVDDHAPNAFAVGRGPASGAVAVTTGLLARLDRDELQGVIAHEIGHIKNRDTALMTTAGVMVGTIVVLAEISWRALRWGAFSRRSRSSSKAGGAHLVLFLVALVFLVLAPIFAQALYLALSRRREYLADASGALFTRYPEGLARALEKISVGPPIKDDSRVTAPLYIVRPGRLGTTSFLGGTHPPVEDRIRILRGMGRGAGWRAYDASYRVVKGRGVISAAALERADDPEARALGPSPVETPRARARAASNALFRAAGYAPRICGACHATLRIPPALAASLVNCPRCSAPLPPAPLPSPSAPG